MQKKILQAKRWETDSQVIRKMAEQMKKINFMNAWGQKDDKFW